MAKKPSASAKAEWWFYHIERGSLESALGPLLEKCLERGWRVVITGKDDTLDHLDEKLWTWRDDSFLPHALIKGKGGKTDPASQPILLSSEATSANGAKVAMLLNGSEADASKFDRCIVVFEGSDEAARSTARSQYKAASDSGAAARYFQQDAQGAWSEWQPKKN